MKSDSLAYPNKWEGLTRPPRRLLAVKMNNFIEETTRIPSGTWPHKGRKKKRIRPVTATLAKPRLLDISLLGKIDMSLVKKEFLSMYKLMRVPMDARRSLKKDRAIEDKKDRKIKSEIVIEITPIVEKKDVKILKGNSSFKLCLKNNKNRVDAAFGGPVAQTLPKPCDSCGRESRPERLHAHPQRLAVPEKTLGNRPVSLGERRSPAAKNLEDKDVKSIKERSPSTQEGKKLEISTACSFCGRKFGSLSLQSHESKCREKKESNQPKSEKENLGKEPPTNKISPRIPTPSKSSAREQRKGENENHQRLRPKNASNRRTSLNITVLTPTLSPIRIPSEVEDSCAEEGLNSEEDIEWTNHLRSLVKCNVCDRAFAPDRVLKHQSICDGSSKRPSNQSSRKSSQQKL